MKHTKLAFIVLFLALASRPAAAQDANAAKEIAEGAQKEARQAAGKEEAEVLSEAKKYIDLLKSAQPAQAMEAYWDFDAMLSAIFEKELDKHTPAQREEMQKLLINLVNGVYQDPRIVQAMKDSRVEDLKSDPPKDGVTVVRFNVILGEATLPNVLHFRKKGNAWRVIDGGVNNNLLVPAFRKGFSSVRGKLTPLDFVREVAKPRQQPPPRQPE